MSLGFPSKYGKSKTKLSVLNPICIATSPIDVLSSSVHTGESQGLLSRIKQKSLRKNMATKEHSTFVLVYAHSNTWTYSLFYSRSPEIGDIRNAALRLILPRTGIKASEMPC